MAVQRAISIPTDAFEIVNFSKMTSEICIVCNQNGDDVYRFGEKITIEDVTAHHFCLLLTSNLAQNGDDDEGIYGFMPEDIKKEVSRAKKLFCHYCREKGATIGCCFKSCRRSFHLLCALQSDCRLEFTGSFRSFCDTHHEIKRPKHVHKPTDLCTVCYDEMGKYNKTRSIPLPCCNKNAWCHKLCLQKYAQTSGYFLKCPLCKDSDKFRRFIAERGVFIPDRDAKWEVEDSGPNTFYDFEQHSERPSKCEAQVCKCKKGRTYQVDIENHKYSLAFCHYCGSDAVHMSCFEGEDYLCEECTTIANRVRENAANASSAYREANSQRSTASFYGHDGGSNVRREYHFDDFLQSRRHLITQFKLREFSIDVIRLTDKDLSTLRGQNKHSETRKSNENRITNEKTTKPMMLKNKRVSRAKRSRRSLHQNQFIYCDNTYDTADMVDDNNNNNDNHIDRNSEYFLVSCERCGSYGDKTVCKASYICDDCMLEPSAKKRKKIRGHCDYLDYQFNDLNNNNISMNISTSRSPQPTKCVGQFVQQTCETNS